VVLDASDMRATHVLPYGLLLNKVNGPARTSFHIIGTGFSHTKSRDDSSATTRLRLLGIPIWTSKK